MENTFNVFHRCCLTYDVCIPPVFMMEQKFQGDGSRNEALGVDEAMQVLFSSVGLLSLQTRFQEIS